MEIYTASLRTLVISVLWIYDQFFLWSTTASGVWPPAPCCRRCVTRRLIAATVHALGCTVSPFIIDSPLTTFFWLVKKRWMKYEEEHTEGLVLVAGVGDLLT